MAQYLMAWDDAHVDGIVCVSREPVVVTCVPREDMRHLATVEQSSLPGVYVLCSSSQRYVGQSYASMASRISRHEKEKGFWDYALLIARESTPLDRSQLDFLERHLIATFSSLGYHSDNVSPGNQSPIIPYQKASAMSVLATAKILEEHHIRRGTFAPCTKKTCRLDTEGAGGDTVPPTASATVWKIHDGTRTATHKAARLAYVKYLEKLLGEESYGDTIRNELRRGSSLGTLSEPPEEKSKWFCQIGNVWVHYNMSVKTMVNRVSMLSKLTGLNIVVEKVEEPLELLP